MLTMNLDPVSDNLDPVSVDATPVIQLPIAGILFDVYSADADEVPEGYFLFSFQGTEYYFPPYCSKELLLKLDKSSQGECS